MTMAVSEPGEAPTERFSKTVPIGGQDILMQNMTHAQFMQMSHEYGQLRSDVIPSHRKTKAMDRVYRIIRSLVVEEDQREFVEDSIADGTVDFSDLIDALKEVYEDHEELQGATGPKVRRGRQTQRRR